MFACITSSITALFPVNDPQELGVWELYDTSRGTKISLDELACRPGVLASSCTDWRPNSTSESPHVRSASQTCPQSPSRAKNSTQAAEAPVVQPRSQMRNPRAVDSCSRGWGPRFWASGEGVSLPGCAAQVPTEHTTARPCAPSPRRGAARSPQPGRPRCGGPGQGAETAAPRPLRPGSAAPWGRGGASERASQPRRREIPQCQTQTRCRPGEPRWEEHLCPVTSSYWCSKEPVAAFLRRMSFPECLEVISTTKWLGLRNRGEILHAQGCVLGKRLAQFTGTSIAGLLCPGCEVAG